MKQLLLFICMTCFSVLFFNLAVYAQEWKKIDDQEVFRQIYTDTILRGVSWPTANLDIHHLDTNWQIKYCADGTGVLTFWENETPRTWEIIGNDKVCISTAYGEKCYFCEENLKYNDIFRCGVAGTKEAPWVFRVTTEKPDICP